jgi:putrescine transport system substrate-binding protein
VTFKKARLFVKKLWVRLLLLLGLGGILFLLLLKPFEESSSEKILRLYSWSHYIPQDVIQAFETEMKVKIFYDVFENLETLEAKLLAARSGYDVVFPAAWPTVALFIPSGAFLKLDFKELPNARFLDPVLMKNLQGADPLNQYVIPYLWGTTGIAYDAEKLKKIAPDAPVNSWKLLFDVSSVKKLSTCHVALPDSPSDVFPGALLFLEKDPNSQRIEDLEKSANVLEKIRPYVTKFDSSQTIQDLMSGELCAAQIFSTYGNMAAYATRHNKNGPRILFRIPEEGALMWMDVMAIPKDAPNEKLAHAFINFMMRPDIIARVSNQIRAANAIPASHTQINPDILLNESIYPSASMMKKIAVDKLPSRAYERKRMRLWTKLKTGH